MKVHSELQVVRYLAKISALYPGFGADWNEQKSLLRLTQATWKEICHASVAFCLPVFWLTLSVCRAAEIQLRNRLGLDQTLQLLYKVLPAGHMAMVLIIVGFAVSRRSLITLFNQLLSLYEPLGK